MAALANEDHKLALSQSGRAPPTTWTRGGDRRSVGEEALLTIVNARVMHKDVSLNELPREGEVADLMVLRSPEESFSR